MFLRWLHKIWTWFLVTLLVLFSAAVILGGSLFGLLQLDTGRDWLIDRIEEDFRSTYRSELSIGGLDGLLPFEVELNDVTVDYAWDGESETVVRVDSITASLDLWRLLQNTVSVTGFTLHQPRVQLSRTDENSYTLREAFRLDSTVSGGSGEPREWIQNIEIIAPGVRISRGSITADRLPGEFGDRLPEPFHAREIDASLFLELTEQQRFLDIESFSMQVDDLQAGRIALTGQVYNDRRYLEFNAFTLHLGESELQISGEIDGVDLYAGAVTDQLGEAFYDISVQSPQFVLEDFRELVPALPEIGEPLEFSLQSEGRVDSLWVDRLNVGLGGSSIRAEGFLEDLLEPERFRYRSKIGNMVLMREDVELFTGSLPERQYRMLENLRLDGAVNGSSDSVQVDMTLLSDAYGQAMLRGHTLLSPPYRYSFSLHGERVDVSPLIPRGGGTPFFAGEADSTDLNFDFRGEGQGREWETAVSEFSASVYSSTFFDVPVDELILEASLEEGQLSHSHSYRHRQQQFSGRGSVAFSGDEPVVSLDGRAERIDLAQVLPALGTEATALNFEYRADLRGGSPDRLQGRANLDILPSVIGGDSVQAHQFYVDLDDPAAQTRNLRLTSSFLDLNLSGSIAPENIYRKTRYWTSYLARQFDRQFLLNGTETADDHPPDTGDPVVMQGDLQVKNLELLQRYWPQVRFPETDASVRFDLNADANRLLLNTEFAADTLTWNGLQLADADADLTASFRGDRPVREYSSIAFQSDIGRLQNSWFTLDTSSTRLIMERDSVHLAQTIGGIGGETRLELEVDGELGDAMNRITVPRFFLGNETYAWTNSAIPRFDILQDERILFHDVEFRNREERLVVTGVLSNNSPDSLEYEIRNVNLERISDLIRGEIVFDGEMSGSLTTRSLTRQPSVQGSLRVNRFELNDRLIGDASFLSRYNPAMDRFDTRVRVITDSTRYGEYLEENDGIGQNITLDGWFVAPDLSEPQDTVYHFDADFREIDMWVIPIIVKALDQVEGRSNGTGWITGNMEEYDFHADFEATNVYARPRFLNTNYFVNGEVVLDRREGVVLDSLQLTDTKGGRGVVWGTVDLNDFQPITYLDLHLSMDGLEFMNNTYDPDIPFYGNVSGTGEAHLSGANTDLFLRTQDPIELTSDSRVFIPLIEETELNADNTFIRFVDSFDDRANGEIGVDWQNGNGGEADVRLLDQAIDNLTFTERFDLDLQFNAGTPLGVDLVFDRLTGEILSSRGTGQIRLSMQDEELQMFGRYSITEGTYQFVTGEIISRRLDLEPGGTIVWQGDPANAQLDINAVYHARPDISTLNFQAASGNVDGTGQRVPIDLVVEITGTVTGVENDYYFRLPNTLELSSNSTLSFTLNQINRDEQQKLFQATSILLTEQFIPMQEAATSLGESLRRGSTVINPILSNQVISPLLSNQINSLLNSDVSRFDIDFNLNTYNEIDLGIALRLYNDRLILRREGQITGERSFGDRIGDLNATYRIRRGLSLTAFHRQDHVIGNYATSPRAGDLTPSIDGVGLEAQVQFNTWQELKRRTGNFFRTLLGIRDEEEQQQNGAESEQEGDS